MKDKITKTRYKTQLKYIIEELEDTKVVIRIRKSKTDSQYSGQKKKDKRANNDLIVKY